MRMYKRTKGEGKADKTWQSTVFFLVCLETSLSRLNERTYVERSRNSRDISIERCALRYVNIFKKMMLQRRRMETNLAPPLSFAMVAIKFAFYYSWDSFRRYWHICLFLLLLLSLFLSLYRAELGFFFLLSSHDAFTQLYIFLFFFFFFTNTLRASKELRIISSRRKSCPLQSMLNNKTSLYECLIEKKKRKKRGGGKPMN